jgi:hypothetical protein
MLVMDVIEHAKEEHEQPNLDRLQLTLVGSIKLMKRTRRDMKRTRRNVGQQPQTPHDRRSIN